MVSFLIDLGFYSLQKCSQQWWLSQKNWSSYILAGGRYSEQLIELQDNSGQQDAQVMDEMNFQMLEEQEQAIRQLEVRGSLSHNCRYRHVKFRSNIIYDFLIMWILTSLDVWFTF